MKVKDILQKASREKRSLQQVSDETVSEILRSVAGSLRDATDDIIEANARDLSRMSEDNPKYDRLKLTPQRIDGIASDMENVAGLPSPLGSVLSETIRPNGMTIRKVSVPFGVVGVIYEARPNVTADVFSLCFRSGNVCVLKGGSDADESSRAIVSIIHKVLESYGVDPAVCTLLPADREATAELLGAVGLVDVLIPRGSSTLINYVRDNARIPVIETGAGICHTYFDKDPKGERMQCPGLSDNPQGPSGRPPSDMLGTKRKQCRDICRPSVVRGPGRKLSFCASSESNR